MKNRKSLESDTDSEESSESEMVEETVPPAEGCEDAVAETEESESSYSSDTTAPKWWSLYQKVSKIFEMTKLTSNRGR